MTYIQYIHVTCLYLHDILDVNLEVLVTSTCLTDPKIGLKVLHARQLIPLQPGLISLRDEICDRLGKRSSQAETKRPRDCRSVRNSSRPFRLRGWPNEPDTEGDKFNPGSVD